MAVSIGILNIDYSPVNVFVNIIGTGKYSGFVSFFFMESHNCSSQNLNLILQADFIFRYSYMISAIILIVISFNQNSLINRNLS